MPTNTTYTLLCLGDSYTIGEAVSEEERFPNQTVALLYKEGYHFSPPVIIAKTGWTTDELATAIAEKNITQTFHFVTLLIGVNNQYRQRDIENYRTQFYQLLQTAINYAGGNKQHVFVLSIPDWGVTPFVAQDAHKRSAAQISAEVENFNKVGQQEALKAGVNYIDITPISKKAETNLSYLAYDHLHPSGAMYAEWAEMLKKELMNRLK